MKILFICSANKQRSKTAEDYFSEEHPDYNFLSADTNHKICNKEGTTPLTEDLLVWADKVYVMEQKHLNIISKNTGSKYFSKIENLNIPDVYKYYDKTLIGILSAKIEL